MLCGVASGEGPGGPISEAQNLALDRLRGAAVFLIDGRDGSEKAAVPRSPTEDWGQKIKDARISYHGELVLKAEPLELDRVVASLPPLGFGGAVRLEDLCEGEVRERILDPSSCLLPEADMPLDIPRPKVRVKDDGWEPQGAL